MSGLGDTLERLAAIIAERAAADPDVSYTARLLAGGPAKAAKKLGEEATEVIIAALEGELDQVAGESADLLYHWLVLLQTRGVTLDAVAAKLAAREGTSGLVEKAARNPETP
jgi:phosphoribosyl-ATP pyrophosphohydrolase